MLKVVKNIPEPTRAQRKKRPPFQERVNFFYSLSPGDSFLCEGNSDRNCWANVARYCGLGYRTSKVGENLYRFWRVK